MLRRNGPKTGCLSARVALVWFIKLGWRYDGLEHDYPPLPSTLAIAVMVFQLRVVTGIPKSRSNVPR
jgi:hypothetical protein